MSLRQNRFAVLVRQLKFSYQSECHCAKTRPPLWRSQRLFSYQSECHCAKTYKHVMELTKSFSYQSECHCAKTAPYDKRLKH